MAEQRIIPHNLPWKEVGRVKHCVIENLPVIGTEEDAPEAYVGGAYVDYILSAVNSHEALLAALQDAKNLIKIWHGSIAWDAYDAHSPEMLRINRALALAGTTQFPLEHPQLKSLSEYQSEIEAEEE